MKKFVPVVFAIDNNYVKQLSTCIISILKNSSKRTEFEFNILHTNVEKKNQEIMCSLKNKYPNANFKFIDINEYIKGVDLEKYMARREGYTYISVETYYRFFIPEIFPQYKKILYLDGDILAFKDITKLFDINIDDYYAGVVNDLVMENFVHDEKKSEKYPELTIPEYFKQKLFKNDTKYFNAGVLLLNLDKIRKDNITEKLWKFTVDNSPLEYQDQDVLNAVFADDVKYIDPKWNVLRDKWAANRHFNKLHRFKLMHIYRHPKLFHFVGSDKPWVYDKKSLYAFDNIKTWWKYYKKSPFFDKNDLPILERILFQQKTFPYRTLICININNYVLIHLYIFEYYFRVVLFDLYRRSIYYKKPVDFDKEDSI